MSEATGRQHPGENTRDRIRATARTLLVGKGPEALTLRAIARALQVTAPALYRYYSSREELVQHVCLDICAELAEELLAAAIVVDESRPTVRLLRVCRGFRGWALAHPREFELVFVAPVDLGADPITIGDELEVSVRGGEPFGRVFLAVAVTVLTNTSLRAPAADSVPEALRAELRAFRDSLPADPSGRTPEPATGQLDLGTVNFLLTFWVRLYGHVVLEVFRRFPLPVSNTEPLFEAMMAEQLAVLEEIEPPSPGRFP
ncbi:MAG: TetR/AcrR family transcriptional regulator [Sciscionella sp.]